MESCINILIKDKGNVNDITYMSELIPAVSLCEAKRNKAAGINSHNNLCRSKAKYFTP